MPRRKAEKNLVTNSEESSDEDDDSDDWSDSWLVTGGSDNSLRKWDVTTGRVIDRMATDKIRGERTLVWTVGVLGFVVRFRGIGFLIYDIPTETVPSYLVTPLAWSNFGIRGHVHNFRHSRHMVLTCFAWL